MRLIKAVKARIRERDSAAHFEDAELLLNFWETSPEIVKKLLPAPLQPGPVPVAMGVLANYRHTSFGEGYLESSLYLMSRHNGENGMFCISMPITSEPAADGHSKLLEYPRKVANAAFMSAAGGAAGSGERFGLNYFSTKAWLNGEFNSDDAHELIDECMDLADPVRIVHFNYSGEHYYKYLPFESDRFIYRREVTIYPVKMEKGHADIQVARSIYEPWFRVAVTRVLGAVYIRGDCSFSAKKRMARADSMQFGPYAFSNWDLWVGR
jgi:acetoacetate decarboxylase